MPDDNKVLITVETQTDENDLCMCFIPEFKCQHNVCTEIDPRITVTLDTLKTGDTNSVVIRNFEANKRWQSKQRWKIAGHALRAISRINRQKGKKQYYDLTLTQPNIEYKPEKSGLYVIKANDLSKPATPKQRRNSLIEMVSGWKKNRKKKKNGFVSKDRRSSLQSFTYTSVERDPPEPTAQKVESIEVKQEKEINTLVLKGKYDNKKKVNAEINSQHKPLIHKDKSHSMHDMKSFMISADSYDRFCTNAASSEKLSHLKNEETQSMNGCKFRQKKKVSRSSSGSSQRTLSSQRPSSSQRRERDSVSTDKKNRHSHKFLDLDVMESAFIRHIISENQRPKSYFWNPEQVVAQLCEMERRLNLEEQRGPYPYTARDEIDRSSLGQNIAYSYTARERYGSYYDIQKGKKSRSRPTIEDKEFTQFLLEARRQKLANKESRGFDPLREGVAFDRLATPINHAEANVGKDEFFGNKVNSRDIPLRTPGKEIHRRQLSNSDGVTNSSPLSSMASTDESSHSKRSSKYRNRSSAVSDSEKSTADQDLSLFALVPGTKLHRKLSLRGVNDRAPVHVLTPPINDSTPQVNGIFTTEVSQIPKRKSFRSVEDLYSTKNTEESLLQISLSADDVNNEDIMNKVSARSKQSSPIYSKVTNLDKSDVQLSDEIYDDDNYATYV